MLYADITKIPSVLADMIVEFAVSEKPVVYVSIAVDMTKISTTWSHCGHGRRPQRTAWSPYWHIHRYIQFYSPFLENANTAVISRRCSAI
jgi:hypothetical protein